MIDPNELRKIYLRHVFNAAASCKAIFDDYAESEIKKEPLSIQGAWKVGRDIVSQAAKELVRPVAEKCGVSEDELDAVIKRFSKK